MYENKLGSFNIQQVYGGQTYAVRLWTDAPVNSPYAQEMLLGLLRKRRGIAEIIDINGGEHFLIIEMSDAVTSDEQAKEVVRKFMLMVCESTQNFGHAELDLLIEEHNAPVGKLMNAMATSSKGGHGLVSHSFG
ncbi:hypothetical protein H0V99_00065 [Candidatus Saccharibacteria bacterium]|nr:hypothetical protein [Candidatus Saccharibacteria bacterium]